MERFMKKKVICAGHICLDITPKFKSETLNDFSHIFVPGHLTEVGGAAIHTGGSVANTGLAMKLFLEDKADVVLKGIVGDDDLGRLVLNILNNHDASEGMIIDKEASSSYTIALALPGYDRIFFHNPGPNDTFDSFFISEEELKNASLFHFGYPTLMKKMYENDGAETIKLFKKVKASGCITSLDLTVVDTNSEAAKSDWEYILRSVLPFVDIFTPSAEEVCYMLEPKLLKEWKNKAKGQDVTAVFNIENEIKPLAQKCLDLGAKIVLLKCGKPGIYSVAADKNKLSDICDKLGISENLWSNFSAFEQSYTPRQLLSGTGAGDTSIAAFLSAIITGRDPDNCLRLACAAGCSCLEGYDSLSGLRPFNQLEKRIADGWRKSGKDDL